MQLTTQLLIACGADPRFAERYVAPLNTQLPAAGINTPLRMAHAISQWLHESVGFTKGTESLDYTPERLMATFNNKRITRFPLALANQLGRIKGRPANQVRIGNIAYGNRLGNGPESSGDGYRYRGRSITQLTGKNHYVNYGKRLGIDLVNNPDLATTPDVSVQIAVAFWVDNRLNFLADKDDVVGVTRVLNGGENGIDDRRQLLTKCKAALMPATATV